MKKWEKVRLADCCEIVSGATPSTNIKACWEGDICWATPKDLSELEGGLITTTSRKLTLEGLNSCAASILPPGSVLFSSRAPIGYVAINAAPMATNQGFKSFVPRSGVIDSGFLYWWLRTNRPYLERLGNGATFKEVSKAVLSRVEISLPPLPAQRRIAAVLDRAEELRAKRCTTLAQLDTITQTLFLDMFGDPGVNPKDWPVRPLSALVRSDDTINYGVIQPGDDIEGGIPLIRVGDLLGGRVVHSSLKRIAPRIESAYKRSRLRGDEILVSCVGSIGVVALADETVKGFNIARAVARIPLSEMNNRIFTAAYLKTRFAQNYFSKELRTVSQPTLNIKQLSETPVVLPPLGLQREFANRVAAVDNLRAVHRTSLAELDALFASLQHRAFRGEL
jgi:type I restriction enzyme S subunit